MIVLHKVTSFPLCLPGLHVVLRKQAMLGRPMWQGTEGSLQPTDTKALGPTDPKNLHPTNNHVSLEADPSPGELFRLTP